MVQTKQATASDPVQHCCFLRLKTGSANTGAFKFRHEGTDIRSCHRDFKTLAPTVKPCRWIMYIPEMCSRMLKS
jgi:hypothetical protein